jgi:8-oxo-dGTP pyrophosphatase MutT (NUDIX family)
MASVSIRVRAILVDPNGRLVVIKRERPGTPAYYVFPGGGMEDSDETPEAAIRREIREELGGEIATPRLVHLLEREKGDGLERELYYHARLVRWTGEQTGPEFSEPDRGGYALEFVDLTQAAVTSIDLKPDSVAAFLAANATTLDTLPTISEPV